jgi:phosphatidylglycerophosphate synthase
MVNPGMATVNQPLTLSYQIIRKEYQTHCGIEPVLVDHYAKLLSPLLTPLFVRFGIIPNVVTVFMMVSGIVGAAFFALPPLWAKIAGLFFIHLWYVLDCCDGEVARITKRFSRMGTEIDYTAHLVCHPLFNLAFAISLIQLHRYDARLILLIATIGISAELMLRNLLTLRSVFQLKEGPASQKSRQNDALAIIRKGVIQALCTYPNLALVLPICFAIDIASGTSVSFYYLLVQTSVSVLMAARGYASWLRMILWT